MKVAICLPDYGFDPTEAGVPFKFFKDKGCEVEIVTQDGKEPQCDPRMITGATGVLLGAKTEGKAAYLEMSESASCRSPKSWTSTGFSLLEYDVLILPGGHDKGVKQIIESESLAAHLREFFPLTRGEVVGKKKVCGAICHGVLVLAWAKDVQGNSLLYDRKTTTLPEYLEKMAYLLTAPVLGDYYRTYPGKYTAGLVQERLKDPAQYTSGPYNFTLSYARSAAYVVHDERYISARWPGDSLVWSEAVYEEAVKAGLT